MSLTRIEIWPQKKIRIILGVILHIETSTTNCSVSLGKDGKLIHFIEDNSLDYSHGESLHVFIERLLKEAKIHLKDLSAIAVSEGPGSYTGLRIGVSAAKGLCFALDVPLISISTLCSLAHQAKVSDGIVIPMLDARRMEVYSAIYDANYQPVRETEAEIINSNSFENYLEKDTVYFIGNCNDKVKPIINSKNAKFSDFVTPSSKEMVKISFAKFKNGDFESLAYFKPFYLKQFKAG